MKRREIENKVWRKTPTFDRMVQAGRRFVAPSPGSLVRVGLASMPDKQLRELLAKLERLS